MNDLYDFFRYVTDCARRTSMSAQGAVSHEISHWTDTAQLARVHRDAACLMAHIELELMARDPKPTTVTKETT